MYLYKALYNYSRLYCGLSIIGCIIMTPPLPPFISLYDMPAFYLNSTAIVHKHCGAVTHHKHRLQELGTETGRNDIHHAPTYC